MFRDPANNGAITLVGASSWGLAPCADPDKMAVFTDISFYMDWLLDNMPDLNTCPPFEGSPSPPAPSPPVPTPARAPESTTLSWTSSVGPYPGIIRLLGDYVKEMNFDFYYISSHRTNNA